jgi:hypothetical protein
MKYDASSIKVLDDPIAFIRQRPEMFVGVAEVQPEFLATSLAHDALALGVRQVEIHHVGAHCQQETKITEKPPLDSGRTVCLMFSASGRRRGETCCVYCARSRRRRRP